MSKQEFLNELEDYLSSEVSQRVIAENLQFYSDYFDSEMAKGISADEVSLNLGGPNAIARTIIQAADPEERTVVGEADAEAGPWSDEGRERFEAGKERFEERAEEVKNAARDTMSDPRVRLTTAAIIALVIIVLVVILALVILGGVLKMVFTYPLIFIGGAAAIYIWNNYNRRL